MAEQKWSAEQRAEALAIYAVEGPAAASVATKINKSTISSWARREGVTIDRVEVTDRTATARAVRAASLADAKMSEREKLAEVARLYRERAYQAALENNSVAAQRWAASWLPMLRTLMEIDADDADRRRQGEDIRPWSPEEFTAFRARWLKAPEQLAVANADDRTVDAEVVDDDE